MTVAELIDKLMIQVELGKGGYTVVVNYGMNEFANGREVEAVVEVTACKGYDREWVDPAYYLNDYPRDRIINITG